MPTTLKSLLAPHTADSFAIGAPDRDWLTYGGLRSLSADVAAQLRSAGVGVDDRVAIVLPNGPEMAAAFVTIAQAAVTAPLNPAYRRDEYAFYLEDLKAKALVVMADDAGPAVEAATASGLMILRLHVDTAAPAGTFTLKAEGTPTTPP